MDVIPWADLFQTIIGGFPVFGAMAAGWVWAELRARDACKARAAAERRTREIYRDMLSLPSEAALNGGGED